MKTRTWESGSRLIRRLLIFVAMGVLAGAVEAKADPAKTLVQDTLYRADGSAAHGSVTIRWGGFSTSAGEAVAAGQMTVTTDAGGKVSIPLIANTGATPSGSYYRAVIKLDDGTTSEEQWVVPSTATTTIAAIRAKVVPQAVAAQFVSRDYLDSLLGGSSPNALVHLSGAETIAGVKTFMSSPEVPAPTDAGGAANKRYVDQAISGLATVASTGSYNDLTNKPVALNLAAPGAIGTTTPGVVNATAVTAQSVNGVYDASAFSNLQAAVSALASTGGKLTIGPGTYNLSSEVLLATATGAQYTICGSGASTVLNITGTNKAIHVTGATGSTISRFKLCDMAIVSNSSSTAAAAVHLDGIAVFDVENVHIVGNGKLTYGFQLSGSQQGEISGGSIFLGGSGIGIQQETSPQQGTGFPIAPNAVEVHGVSFNGGGGTSIGIQLSGVDDTPIHSNHFVNFATAISDVLGGYGVINVYDNHFELCTTAGISSVAGLRVTGNSFYTSGNQYPTARDVIGSGVIAHNLLQSG